MDLMNAIVDRQLVGARAVGVLEGMKRTGLLAPVFAGLVDGVIDDWNAACANCKVAAADAAAEVALKKAQQDGQAELRG